MGEDSHAKAPLVIEVDKANPSKDIDALDIEIPILTRRVYREYKGLADLTITPHDFKPVTYQEFTEAEQREIVFRDLTTDEVTHTTVLDSTAPPDYRSVLNYFARTIMKELKLVSGYDVLYGKAQSVCGKRTVRARRWRWNRAIPYAICPN